MLIGDFLKKIVTIVRFDKLKKYLPTMMKSQGIGGLGLSESTALNAYKNYMSERGSINDSFLEKSNQLLQKYNTDMLANQQTSEKNVAGVLDRYRQKWDDNEAEDRSNFLDGFITEMEAIRDDENPEKLLNYLEQNKDLIGEDSRTYQLYHNLATSKLEEKQNEEKEKKKQYEENVINGKEGFIFQDKAYQIAPEMKKVDRYINDNKKKLEDGLKSLGYSGISDSNITNGTTVNIDGDINLTYYNGNWYFSRRKYRK